MVTGVIEEFGWDKYRSQENPRRYVLPATTLGKLVADIRDRMKIKALRVIGDPQLPVSRLTFSPGYTTLPVFIRAFDADDVDVLVMGETQEWTGVELARDSVTLGRKKGLIILGHVPSEEAGMKECAKWLKTFVPEVPIEFIPSANRSGFRSNYSRRSFQSICRIIPSHTCASDRSTASGAPCGVSSVRPIRQ